jgi:hypothetical protein
VAALISTHHPTGDWARHGGSYFTVHKIRERWRRGWQVAYWRQPLAATSEEFAAAGFLIERIHEPQPSAAMHERYPRGAAWLAVNPGFIVFSLVNR